MRPAESVVKNLLDLRAGELLDAFAGERAAPAAGSAAALTAALAAALVGMVARLTSEKSEAGSERLRARYGPYRQRADEISTAADRLRAELQGLVQEDAQLVEALVGYRRLRGEARTSAVAMGPAGELEYRMVKLPLQITVFALQIADYAQELCRKGYQSAAGDAAVAVTLARAAAEASLAVAAGNLAGVQGNAAWVAGAREEYQDLTERLSSTP